MRTKLKLILTLVCCVTIQESFWVENDGHLIRQQTLWSYVHSCKATTRQLDLCPTPCMVVVLHKARNNLPDNAFSKFRQNFELLTHFDCQSWLPHELNELYMNKGFNSETFERSKIVEFVSMMFKCDRIVGPHRLIRKKEKTR